MQQFFVVKPDGSREGPFDAATIEQMRAAGQIGATDEVVPAEGPAFTAAQASSYATPPQASAKKSPIFWVLLGACAVCIPCIAVFAAVLFPVFSQAKQAARMASTLSELKQVGKAMLVYTVDHDDLFPPKMDSLSDCWTDLAGYAQGPMPESKNPNHPEILGNGGLGGTLSTKVLSPQRTYEFFDSVPWTTDKRVVLFVDSHADKVSEADFQAGVLNGMVGK